VIGGSRNQRQNSIVEGQRKAFIAKVMFIKVDLSTPFYPAHIATGNTHTHTTQPADYMG
jgi:hypothetical protein